LLRIGANSSKKAAENNRVCENTNRGTNELQEEIRVRSADGKKKADVAQQTHRNTAFLQHQAHRLELV